MYGIVANLVLKNFKGHFNAIIIFNFESITFSVKQRENTFADP